MNCPKCGCETAEGVKFCGACGALIAAAPMGDGVQPPTPSAQIPKAPIRFGGAAERERAAGRERAAAGRAAAGRERAAAISAAAGRTHAAAISAAAGERAGGSRKAAAE